MYIYILYVVSLYSCCYFFVFINVYIKQNVADLSLLIL